jgi:hypothetical protein
VIENRAGGDGYIGLEGVAGSDPDGWRWEAGSSRSCT